MKDLVAATRVREQEQQRLLEEYERAPKNVNRATFVRRITEIIKNIKKQEVEIVKIIADTREVRGRTLIQPANTRPPCPAPPAPSCMPKNPAHAVALRRRKRLEVTHTIVERF